MATKLTENYFQTPNAIFEADLTIYQKMVYIYICRRGNQGGQAYPGYGRIAKDCGMSKPQAKRSVKALESKGYITVERRRINERINESNIYDIKNMLGGISQISGVVSDRYQGSISQIPKEEPVNKNNTKKNDDSTDSSNGEPSTKEMVNLYYDLYNEFVGVEPLRSYGKDCSIIKKSGVADRDFTEVKTKLERWFKNADDYIRGKNYPLQMFVSRYNEIKTTDNDTYYQDLTNEVYL
jgi:DNA-binding Lrp family transcriptional regulator